MIQPLQWFFDPGACSHQDISWKSKLGFKFPTFFYMKNPIPHPPEGYYYQIPCREGKGVKCPGEYLGGLFWFLS